MLVATCNRFFQISSETRTIEIDDSIERMYASDTERDRESYTEVCGVCLSRPIILDASDDLHKLTCTFVAFSLGETKANA
jgi:hypothetical protein